MRRLTLALVLVALACTAPVADAAPSANTAALQVALRATGDYAGTVDGVAGTGTRAAVRAFQSRHGLVVDGIAGQMTRRALGRRGRPAWGSRVLREGARGRDVAVLQFKLARRGFPSGPFDGGFGARVDGAVRRFQTWAGMTADGVVGRGTRAALQQRRRRGLKFECQRTGGFGLTDGLNPGPDSSAKC